MILLADGGSTKVDWVVVEQGKINKRITTQGANPFFRTSKNIAKEWEVDLLPKIADLSIKSVSFFGAGCANEEKNDIISQALKSVLGNLPIEIGSDLLGAAKALCENEPGIACILGTGSNSCFYDGKNIVENISPLGYILGDEGSGAVLGRLFLGACLKNQFGESLKEKFLTEIEMTPTEIINKVYRDVLPNRFLASLTPFIKTHLDDRRVYELVYKNFEDFFRKNVMQYDWRNHPINFTGSIAFYFQEVLLQAARSLGITVKTICQSPMAGLVNYYSLTK